MSAIGGYLSRDGSEVSASTLTILAEALSRLGGDNTRTAISHPAGMLFRLHNTTDAQTVETHSQPLVRQNCYVTFDGRLDNRHELCRTLEIVDNPVDAELVLLSYLRWGPCFVSRLFGDFSLALWDPAQQRLLLARDPFGIKQLFYTSSPARVLWASTADSLLPFIDTVSVSKAYLAGYLWFLPDENCSPFNGVIPVAPGSYVVFEPGGVSVLAYWTIRSELNTIRHNADADYEEHFRTLFTAAVHDRLRSNGPVAAELSGGLDSSSIACTADNLLSPAARSSLHTLSFLFPEHPGTDEREFIEAVEARLAGPHHHVAETTAAMLSPSIDKTFISYPSMLLCFPGRVEGPSAVFRRHLIRVVLSGEGGDHVFRGDEPVVTQNNPGPGLSGHVRRLMNLPGSQNVNLWYDWWRRVARPGLKPGHLDQAPVPALFSRRFVADSGLEEHRFRLSRCLSDIDDHASRRHCWNISAARLMLSSGCQRYHTSSECMDVRFPFLDRRLIRFLLSVPPEQLWRPGESRSLLRRSMRNILPELVRSRKGKGSGTDSLSSALQENALWISRLIDSSILVQSGYLVREPLLQSFTHLRHGLLSGGWLHFVRFLAAELWLRNVYQGQYASRAT